LDKPSEMMAFSLSSNALGLGKGLGNRKV